MARSALPRFEDRLALGSLGLQVSPFCIGIVREPQTVLAAFDAGINFFFVTADMHWPLYENTRRGLGQLLQRGGDVRDRLVVATVCYVTQPEFCGEPHREVLEELPALQRIDVLLAGGAYGPEIDRRAAIYAEHRQTRFLDARGIGASFHDRPAAAQHCNAGRFDICFARYNASHPGAEQDLFPQVTGRSALLFGFSNLRGYVSPARCDELGLAPELWRPELTDAYRFALTPQEVDGLLIAPAIPAHIDALARALDKGPLTEDEREYMRSLSLLDRGLADMVVDGAKAES